MRLKAFLLNTLGVTVSMTLLALSGGVAWATVDDYATRDVVPAGVTVEGIPIGGLTRTQAREIIVSSIAAPLLRPVEVSSGSKTFTLDPTESLRVDVDRMLEEAFDPTASSTLAERVARRVSRKPRLHDVSTRLSLDGAPLDAWVAEVAEQIDRPSVDATIARDPQTDRIVKRRSRVGYRTDRRKAVELISAALLDGSKAVTLPVETVEPAVDETTLGHTIVVDLSERKLTLYDGLEIEKTYGVAVGAPGHSTPRGSWHIVSKRYMPSWSNPGSAWAADMPDYIPPGISNPLGTRALDLDAPAIRIHGTTKDGSIGTAASHGCMRMHRWDIEDLYERVDVGTPVLIIG